IVVRHGTSSSISLGASCPSDCANGPTGSDQWDLVFRHSHHLVDRFGVLLDFSAFRLLDVQVIPQPAPQRVQLGRVVQGLSVAPARALVMALRPETLRELRIRWWGRWGFCWWREGIVVHRLRRQGRNGENAVDPKWNVWGAAHVACHV